MISKIALFQNILSRHQLDVAISMKSWVRVTEGQGHRGQHDRLVMRFAPDVSCVSSLAREEEEEADVCRWVGEGVDAGRRKGGQKMCLSHYHNFVTATTIQKVYLKNKN